MPETGSEWWKPIIHFATHAVVGMAIFLVVAIPAALLHWLVDFLEAVGVVGYVLIVLTGLEYTLVTLDAIGLVAYLVVTLYKAIKEWAR